MKKFVSFKEVHATPMPAWSAYKQLSRTLPADVEKNAEGYYVIYNKGCPEKEYHSWCPKEEFEYNNYPVESHQTNPSTFQYFAYAHLPPEMQRISRPMSLIATAMNSALPTNPELNAGMRKLLEAKDCFVRAKIYK